MWKLGLRRNSSVQVTELTDYQAFSPVVRIGTPLHHPLSPPPLGHTRLRERGMGGPQFRRRVRHCGTLGIYMYFVVQVIYLTLHAVFEWCVLLPQQGEALHGALQGQLRVTVLVSSVIVSLWRGVWGWIQVEKAELWCWSLCLIILIALTYSSFKVPWFAYFWNFPRQIETEIYDFTKSFLLKSTIQLEKAGKNTSTDMPWIIIFLCSFQIRNCTTKTTVFYLDYNLMRLCIKNFNGCDAIGSWDCDSASGEVGPRRTTVLEI
jgi:hypothetical protein